MVDFLNSCETLSFCCMLEKCNDYSRRSGVVGNKIDLLSKLRGRVYRSLKGELKNARLSDLDLGLVPLTKNYEPVQEPPVGVFRPYRHLHTKAKRAVYSLYKHTVPEDMLPEEVIRHIEVLLKIDHINILMLHDVCEDFGELACIHLIYEWPDGGMMFSKMLKENDYMTEGNLALITRDLLAACDAAAAFGVYHLDWSPFSLYLPYSERMTPTKVFGFGIAGMLGPLSHELEYEEDDIFKKYCYRCIDIEVGIIFKKIPQQLKEACDVWSVGALLYLFLSGRPPYLGDRHAVTVGKQEGALVFGFEFSHLTWELREVLSKLLEKSTEIRLNAKQVLTERWIRAVIKKYSVHICADAFNRLNKFAEITHAQQTLSRLLIDMGISERQHRYLEKLFHTLDINGDGVITMEELKKTEERMYRGELNAIDPGAIKYLVGVLDRNANNQVDISEFIVAFVMESGYDNEDMIQKAFLTMDENGDSRITKTELFHVLRQYSGSLEPGAVSEFISSADINGDRKMDYEEFKRLFSQEQTRQNAKDNVRKLELKQYVESMQHLLHKIEDDNEKFYLCLRIEGGHMGNNIRELQGGSAAAEKAVGRTLKRLLFTLRDFFGHPKQSRRLLHREEKIRITNLKSEEHNGAAGDEQTRGFCVGLSLLKRFTDLEKSRRSAGMHLSSIDDDDQHHAAYLSEFGGWLTGRSLPLSSHRSEKKKPLLAEAGDNGPETGRSNAESAGSESLDPFSGRSSQNGSARKGGRLAELALMRAGGVTEQKEVEIGNVNSEEELLRQKKRVQQIAKLEFIWGFREEDEKNESKWVFPEEDEPAETLNHEREDYHHGVDHSPIHALRKNHLTQKRKSAAKIAMDVVKVAPIPEAIGGRRGSVLDAALDRIALDLLDDYGFDTFEDFKGLHNVYRLKTVKSLRYWQAPVILCQRDLEVLETSTEMKANERRMVYLEYAHYSLKIISSVIWSLDKFLKETKQALDAYSCIEGSIERLPNKSIRYLRPRGESVGSSARTPELNIKDDTSSTRSETEEYDGDDPLLILQQKNRKLEEKRFTFSRKNISSRIINQRDLMEHFQAKSTTRKELEKLEKSEESQNADGDEDETSDKNTKEGSERVSGSHAGSSRNNTKRSQNSSNREGTERSSFSFGSGSVIQF